MNVSNEKTNKYLVILFFKKKGKKTFTLIF